MSKNSMFKTKKWEHFGSLARNSSVNFLKFLAFWPKSYHVLYKQMDIIVPTKYVIDQQDIEISKNRTVYKTQNANSFGSLAPLARNSSVNFLKFLAFWPKSYHVRYKQMDIIVPTKYVIDQQHIEILKNCDRLRRN